jgi:hypothetical protein
MLGQITGKKKSDKYTARKNLFVNIRLVSLSRRDSGYSRYKIDLQGSVPSSVGSEPDTSGMRKVVHWSNHRDCNHTGLEKIKGVKLTKIDKLSLEIFY